VIVSTEHDDLLDTEEPQMKKNCQELPVSAVHAKCFEMERSHAKEKSLRIAMNSAKPGCISEQRLAKKIEGVQLERRRHSDLCSRCSRQDTAAAQQRFETIDQPSIVPWSEISGDRRFDTLRAILRVPQPTESTEGEGCN
jgi:hypothetical protein